MQGGEIMLHVGKESYVNKDKILAITNADSAPLQRQRQNAEDENKYIYCSNGKKTKALIHLEGGFIVGSSRTVETLIERLERGKKE